VIPKAKVWPPRGYAARSLPRDSRTATLISGLVIVALAALIGKGVNGMGDLLFPAALIGFGVYLLNQRSRASSSLPLSDGFEAGAVESGADDSAGGDVASQEVASEAGRRAARALVTPTVLSLLAIGAGVCWALQAAGVAHVSIVSLAAGGLVIVGLGLLASLWLGRAPGLVFLGVGLAGVMLVASVVAPLVDRARELHAQLPASAGDRDYQPQTLAELQPVYELGMGKLTLDLTQIDFAETTREVRVNLGLGEVKVLVPAGTSLEVHGQVGLGEATVLDRHEEGVSPRVVVTDPGQGRGTLRVDFNVGLGEGTVRRGL
jgi:hypothetical protein